MKKANKSKEKETTVEREEGEFWFEVTPEEYLADVVAGVDPETLIRPGRHKAIRGGFLKRHPDFDSAKAELRHCVTLSLPPVVLEHFKQQAAAQAQSSEKIMEELLIEAARQTGVPVRATMLNELPLTSAVQSVTSREVVSTNKPRRRAA